MREEAWGSAQWVSQDLPLLTLSGQDLRLTIAERTTELAVQVRM